MKTTKTAISMDDIVTDFQTPPQNQGQIVEVSYGATDDYILERTTDRSDGSVTIDAYEYPSDGSEDTGIEPWNCAPSLGRFACRVNLVQTGLL